MASASGNSATGRHATSSASAVGGRGPDAPERMSNGAPGSEMDRLLSAVRGEAGRYATAQQIRVADAISGIAESLGRAARRHDDDAIEASAFSIAARTGEVAADFVRDADLDAKARNIRQAIERRPLVFAAGASIAGFMLARFLKSSRSA